MKENRFIELLNLYVDHQIAPGEASELEAEILHNPERRKTYRDYCQIQRASEIIFGHKTQQVPTPFALEKSLRETERKIIAFTARPKSGWVTYTAAFGGLTAMAACVAFVLLGTRTPPVAPASIVDALALVTAPAPLVVAASQPSNILSTAQTPVQVSRASGTHLILTVQDFSNGREELALSDGAAGTEWMQQVQLPQVQRVIVDNSAFETRPNLQQDNSRVFRSGRPIQGNVEFTAFQFQR